MRVRDVIAGAKPATVKSDETGRPARQLGFFDAVCIMVGIVIGAGIYESPPLVAANVSDPTAV